MRQRRIKNLEEKMEMYSRLLVEEPEPNKGSWKDAFPGRPERLYAEFGCGKGKFIKGMADLHPDYSYIAFEGHQSVLLSALRKAAGADPDGAKCAGASGAEDADAPGNILCVPKYIDLAGEYFDEGELDGIYLNFSDPWPKDRHEKRRLTAMKRLDDYVSIVKSGGSIEFRTDNDDLFDYTMEQAAMLSGARIIAVTRDLHGEINETASRIDLSELEDAAFEEGFDDEQHALADLNITSEYEDKFAEAGKSINYLRLKVI